VMFAFINGQHLLNAQLSSHNIGIYRASYGISAVCVGKLLRQHLLYIAFSAGNLAERGGNMPQFLSEHVTRLEDMRG
jgi:hypothetical protein